VESEESGRGLKTFLGGITEITGKKLAMKGLNASKRSKNSDFLSNFVDSFEKQDGY
jgi:hypothetical protein